MKKSDWSFISQAGLPHGAALKTRRVRRDGLRRGWPRAPYAPGALEIAEKLANGMRNPANIGNLLRYAAEDEAVRFGDKN